MQSAARSATEAKKEVEQEKQRRSEERAQLSASLEQTRQSLEAKLATAERARAQLQVCPILHVQNQGRIRSDMLPTS